MVEKNRAIPPPSPPTQKSLLEYKQQVGLSINNVRSGQRLSRPRLIMQQVSDEETIASMEDIVRFFRLSYRAEGALYNLAAERRKFSRNLRFDELSQWNAQMDTVLLKYEIIDGPNRDVMIREFNKMVAIGLVLYTDDDQTP